MDLVAIWSNLFILRTPAPTLWFCSFIDFRGQVVGGDIGIKDARGGVSCRNDGWVAVVRRM